MDPAAAACQPRSSDLSWDVVVHAQQSLRWVSERAHLCERRTPDRHGSYSPFENTMLLAEL